MVIVAESLERDLGKVNEWCSVLEAKLNVSKTETMIIFMSRILHYQSPQLTIGGTVLKEAEHLDLL